MKKYCLIALTSLKSIMASKSSVWILLSQALIPIIIMGYLWSSILSGNKTMDGMNSHDMIQYYIGTNIINFFVWYAVDWEFNEDIHSGQLSVIIRYPVNTFGYYFSRMIGDRVANITVLAPLLIIIFVLKIKTVFSSIDFIWLFQAVITILVSMVLWFTFSILVGCLAYWFENLFFVLLVKEIIVSFLSGYYFPINLFPSALRKIFIFLPFQYFNYFPVEVVFRQSLAIEWFNGLIIEAFWVLMFFFLYKIVTVFGLKHYSDVLG